MVEPQEIYIYRMKLDLVAFFPYNLFLQDTGTNLGNFQSLRKTIVIPISTFKLFPVNHKLNYKYTIKD